VFPIGTKKAIVIFLPTKIELMRVYATEVMETMGPAGALFECGVFSFGDSGLFRRCLQLLAARTVGGGYTGLPVRKLRQILR
jgi:hypothetical protein